MRKIFVHLFNIAGVLLLLAAALIAWNTYNPALTTPPSDVTIISEDTPPLPIESLPPIAISNSALPVVLPETKLPESSAPDDSVSLADRKTNYRALSEQRVQTQSPAAQASPKPAPAENKPATTNTVNTPLAALDAYRAKAFPPPAHSLPTRIRLPTLNVDSPVVGVDMKITEQNGQQFGEWQVADYVVGFHKTSALPGAVGNTVMAGHNNIKGEVFKNLIDLKLGDEIFVFADDQPYRYIVAQKLLLKERDMPLEQRLQNAQWIAPTTDVRLTLVSCWPYTSNTHRVIIVARPANSQP